jgi:hypothetical protein
LKKTTIAQQYIGIQEMFSNNVANIIHKYFTEEEDREPLTMKSYVRISSLPYLCPREEVICARDKIIRKKIIDQDTSVIFEFGHAFENIVRHRAFGPSGILVGQWECDNCGYVHGAIDGDKDKGLLKRIPMPKVCNVEIDGYGKCTGSIFKYSEESIKNDMFRITGHPDGFLSSNLYDHVLEIKTTNDHRFKMAMRGPFKEHIEQASMYAYLTGKKKILIYYFNKNNGRFCYHEITVDQSLITMVCNRLHILWKGIRSVDLGDNVILPERLCVNSDDGRAKKCDVCKTCFADI